MSESHATMVSRAVLRKASAREQQLAKQVAALKDPALSALYFFLTGRDGHEDGAALRTNPRSHRPGDVRLHRAMVKLALAGLVRCCNADGDDADVAAEWEAVR